MAGRHCGTHLKTVFASEVPGPVRGWDMRLIHACPTQAVRPRMALHAVRHQPVSSLKTLPALR